MVVGSVRVGGGQLPAQNAIKTTEAEDAPMIVTGQPFSAWKYTRRVRVEADGRRVITANGHQTQLGRDRSGRVMMPGAGMADEHCDHPSSGKLPP